MKYLGIITCIVLLVWGVSVLFSEDKWYPAYYPNPADLTTSADGPALDSLEDCRAWVENEARQRGQAVGEYDYECGLNCEMDPQLNILVCDKTVQ